MKPTRESPHAVVDLIDVLLRRGAVLGADVVMTVDGVSLVGIRLQAAIAGKAAMTDHGMIAELDRDRRARANAD